MSLFYITLFVSIFLIAKGVFFFFMPTYCEKRMVSLLRSNLLALLTFGTASIWFLILITQLGEADFGEYKRWLFLIFVVISVGAFFYAKDFLAVRGMSVLTLLLASVILDAAYMYPSQARLFLVSLIYFCIVFALYLGTYPYRARDILKFLLKRPVVLRTLGCCTACYGVVLFFAIFFY